MHRLATVHARDNQRPTNDQRRHDTAYLNKRLFYHGGKNPGGRTLLFSVDHSRGGATFAKWAMATLKHGG